MKGQIMLLDGSALGAYDAKKNTYTAITQHYVMSFITETFRSYSPTII